MKFELRRVKSPQVFRINGIKYYPNYGSVRTVNFTCDVYTNDSLHVVCFPTVDRLLDVSKTLQFNVISWGYMSADYGLD